MGSGITITCTNCDYAKDFRLGIGMMYFLLENVISFVHHKKRQEIQRILNEEKVVDCDYAHTVYTCKKCGEFYERFYVKIFYGIERKVCRLSFNCSKCKTKLKRLRNPHLLETFPCPKCKSKNLRSLPHVLWD